MIFTTPSIRRNRIRRRGTQLWRPPCRTSVWTALQPKVRCCPCLCQPCTLSPPFMVAMHSFRARSLQCAVCTWRSLMWCPSHSLMERVRGHAR